MAVRFERVTDANHSILDRVEADVFDYPLSQERISEYVREANHILLVAIEQGSVIAQIRGVIHRQPDGPTELYIDNLGVASDHRRRGIATRLLEELRSFARDKGCEVLWVATEPENQIARAFYSSQKTSDRLAVVFEGTLD